MVLHTRGRVGRRQLFYKPLSTDLLREAFFVRYFLGEGGASSPEDDASSSELGASPPGEDEISPGEDAFLARNEKK